LPVYNFYALPVTIRFSYVRQFAGRKALHFPPIFAPQKKTVKEYQMLLCILRRYEQVIFVWNFAL